MSKIKILVVEDIPQHAQALINQLNKFGYQSIQHVQTGKKAVVLSS